jgi:hypothetical protein
MSAMFGNTIADQSYRNAGVVNTLVADQLFARSVNFSETNIIDGIDPDIPICTLRMRVPQRFPPIPEISMPLRVQDIPSEQRFYCYEITVVGEFNEPVANQTFRITVDDIPVFTGGSVKNLNKNVVIVSCIDYSGQSFGGCGTKIKELVKLEKDSVIKCTFSETVYLKKLDINFKGIYLPKQDI